ncbi:MAG: hypothetical protein WC565_08585 [Parcubacteria group bacterium]
MTQHSKDSEETIPSEIPTSKGGSDPYPAHVTDSILLNEGTLSGLSARIIAKLETLRITVDNYVDQRQGDNEKVLGVLKELVENGKAILREVKGYDQRIVEIEIRLAEVEEQIQDILKSTTQE